MVMGRFGREQRAKAPTRPGRETMDLTSAVAAARTPRDFKVDQASGLLLSPRPEGSQPMSGPGPLRRASSPVPGEPIRLGVNGLCEVESLGCRERPCRI